MAIVSTQLTTSNANVNANKDNHNNNTVIVNGAVVWDQGKATGARPGRVLSRPAAAH
jgi:N-acyl-D-aspartate/D-glutamate deacylase